MLRVVAATILCSMLMASTAFAQSKAGTTLAAFMGIEPSARYAGMGNAGAGHSGGISSVYFNAGAIGTLGNPAILVTHSEWFAGISYDYAAAAIPAGGFGTFFASVTALNSGDITVRTVSQPLGTGEFFTVSDVALGIGYGRQVTSRFSAGLQVNYISETIFHTSDHLMTFNIGTIYRLNTSGLKIGFGLSNVGTRGSFSGKDLAIQYDNDPNVYGDNSSLPGSQLTDSYQVPILFRLGLSMPYATGEHSELLFLVDALNPNDNTQSVNTGAEWTWNGSLSLRAGYQTLFQQDSTLGPTLGFGIAGNLVSTRYRLDYAWASHDYLDQTQRFTLVLRF
jgi:long-subunit fatty acid transport protein